MAGGLLGRVEHRTNAVEQGIAAARALLHGRDAEAFSSIPTFWSDHFGTRLQTVGVPHLADRVEVIEGALADRKFAAAAHRDGQLVGAVAYGMPRALARLRAQLPAAGCTIRAAETRHAQATAR